MKPSRFTDWQIAFALQPAEPGTQVAEVAHKIGVSEPTFYRGRRKCGGLRKREARFDPWFI